MILKSLRSEANNFEPLRAVIAAAVIIIVTYLLSFVMPDDPADFGAWSLIPAIFLIVYIFITKRILES